MTFRRWLVDQLFTPIQVDVEVAEADVVDLALDDTPAAAAIEHGARTREALRLVEAALALESARSRKTGMRNPDLANLCLEVRSALRPAPVGAEVLREVPSVGIRRAVPYVPGRAA
jgi:hypothetical protein